MYLLNVRFRSEKPVAEVQAMSEGSLPLFRQLPGLLQKYYVENLDTGEIGGVYVWETLEHLQAHVEGPIMAAMPERFAMPAPPTLEIFEVRGDLELRAGEAGQERVIGSVRFSSDLPLDALEQMSAASMGAYRDLPELQRVFRGVEPATGRVGGVYVWSSLAGLEENLASEGVAQIPTLFKVAGPIDVERLRVSMALTD